jgi:hypothetical protein
MIQQSVSSRKIHYAEPLLYAAVSAYNRNITTEIGQFGHLPSRFGTINHYSIWFIETHFAQ